MELHTLNKVLAYIDAHIHEKITLSELSEIACYSPFYFSKLFSEIMGMPVTGYIRIRKLQHSIIQLLDGKKVLDVALLYAFESHEGFTRAFTQLFGSTPSTVRKHLTSYTVPAYVVPKNSNTRRIAMDAEKRFSKTESAENNMHQLAFEFIKHSLEEAKTGYCTKIEITILPDGKIKIADNGRGMPLSKDLHASKAVLNKILAGSPITNAEYSQMGDLTQAGLQTVNSLCETLQITVSKGDQQFLQTYVRGIAQHDLIVNNLACTPGTEVIFKPDTAIFGEPVFSQAVLRNWLAANTAGIESLNYEISVSNA